MSDSSRKHILDQLRQATVAPAADQAAVEPIQSKRYSPNQKVESLKRLMEKYILPQCCLKMREFSQGFNGGAMNDCIQWKIYSKENRHPCFLK